MVLHRVHAQLPVLSDRERDMRRELQRIPEQLRHLGRAIKQVRGAGGSAGRCVGSGGAAHRAWAVLPRR